MIFNEKYAHSIQRVSMAVRVLETHRHPTFAVYSFETRSHSETNIFLSIQLKEWCVCVCMVYALSKL